jgi:hypothetical protein
MNPAHAAVEDPILWECVTYGKHKKEPLKSGCKRLMTTRKIEIPVFTLEQKVCFGILCSLEVYKAPDYVLWATNYLNGKDRSDNAAYAAIAAANAVARADIAAGITANASAIASAIAAASAAADAYAAATRATAFVADAAAYYTAYSTANAARATADAAHNAAFTTAHAAAITSYIANNSTIDFESLAKKALTY